MDWSINSEYISVSCEDGEIISFISKEGIVVSNKQIKNEEWNTCTRPHSWDVKGSTSDNTVLKCSSNGKLVATGNDKGEIRIYKYYNTYTGILAFLLIPNINRKKFITVILQHYALENQIHFLLLAQTVVY
jgi:hypothetical protein